MSLEEEKKIAVLRRAYAAFNARKIDVILAMMQPDIAWPNGMEGGDVHGREAVRAYWTRQWTMVNPHVDPVSFQPAGDERILANVHQVVRDLTGRVLVDQMVGHRYTFREGLIATMEILPAAGEGPGA